MKFKIQYLFSFLIQLMEMEVNKLPIKNEKRTVKLNFNVQINVRFVVYF